MHIRLYIRVRSKDMSEVIEEREIDPRWTAQFAIDVCGTLVRNGIAASIVSKLFDAEGREVA